MMQICVQRFIKATQEWVDICYTVCHFLLLTGRDVLPLFQAGSVEGHNVQESQAVAMETRGTIILN